MTVPILWNIPIKLLDLFPKARSYKLNILFNVIFLHLTEESRNNLKKQGINLFKITYYQQLLFNYISFWKHMNLYLLEFMIKKAVNYEESKIINLGKEILDLFNKNTKFVSLYVQNLHHNNIIEGEHYFSELKYFNCSSERLAIINKSIKKLKYIEFDVRKSGINRLIEVQKNLREVDFTYYPIDSSNPEIVEESLIKCSNTIQYDDGSLLQAIYQNCPNLSCLELTLNDRNISELKMF
ncbi:hypothetical protein RhiirC2_788520 [Rhizophagus irregularis]|uniref:Uncharacterized protein n=1 Tax=Rhizophagus irregularis TaxID=588596 RepID=A0A2N1MPY8_9GLOM|nr:hypothetical protein RhiirC2_788520 [Rhizophagus irregularis]